MSKGKSNCHFSVSWLELGGAAALGSLVLRADFPASGENVRKADKRGPGPKDCQIADIRQFD